MVELPSKTSKTINLSRVLFCVGAFAVMLSSNVVQGAEQENEKVLRHAVFFKFKDNASQTDIDRVVEAFRALPAKIEQIRGFESGKVLADSGRPDGLTHGFLLTFDDEAGRAAYLPHPDHKDFGRVLRPHLDRVFVIDYWGASEKSESKQPLKHAVLLKFKDGVPEKEIKAIENGLSELPTKIDAIKAFEWGKNNSPESHHHGFTHCFMFTFDSMKDLKAYSDHPEHVKIAKELLPKSEKVRVLDFFIAEPDTKRGVQ